MSISSRVQRRHIGEILVSEGLASKEEVDEALRIQDRTKEGLGSILVDMESVSEQDIAKLICQHYQLPFVRIGNYEIDTKLVGLFPPEFLHLNKILPFDRVGEMLLCAVAEVPSDQVLAEIPRITQNNVALYAGSLGEVEQYLKRLRPLPEGYELPQHTKFKPAPVEEPKPQVKAEADDDLAPQIFNEASSEAILEALDSTWDSIFDGIEPGGGAAALSGDDEEHDGQ